MMSENDLLLAVIVFVILLVVVVLGGAVALSWATANVCSQAGYEGKITYSGTVYCIHVDESELHGVRLEEVKGN